MNTKHTPVPLSVGIVPADSRQHKISSEYEAVTGNWDDIYVNFSGYFGSYGPHVFAAAPDLLAALEEAKEELAYFVEFARQQCEFSGDIEAGYSAIRKCLAAIAKARGQ